MTPPTRDQARHAWTAVLDLMHSRMRAHLDAHVQVLEEYFGFAGGAAGDYPVSPAEAPPEPPAEIPFAEPVHDQGEPGQQTTPDQPQPETQHGTTRSTRRRDRGHSS